MARTDIKTRWHKILPLVQAGEVTLTAPPNGKGLWYEDLGGKLDLLTQFLSDAATLPHFVIDHELVNMVGKDDYQRSLYDMKRAKVLRLPYPSMVVEWTAIGDSGNPYTQFVILRDLHATTTRFPWEADIPEKMTEGKPLSMFAMTDNESDAMDFYGIRFSINRDIDGEYLCLSPSILTGSIEQRDNSPWLRFGGYAHALLPANVAINKIVGDTYMKDVGAVFYAVSAAYLLMRTQGIDAETIDTTKINRTRSGKPSQPYIPKHVYIKIGRVYRNLKSDETDEYIPRKSPRPHWRRGHLRHVRYGSGRVNIKEIYIYPKLVALKSDSVVLQPDYRVTK